MTILNLLSQQLLKSMTQFGEHDYSEPSDFPAKDPGGNVLPHQHGIPKEFHVKHLEPYQQEFVDEKGIRELNSYQGLGEK